MRSIPILAHSSASLSRLERALRLARPLAAIALVSALTADAALAVGVTTQTRWGQTPVFSNIPDISGPEGYVAGDIAGNGNLDIVAAGSSNGAGRLFLLVQSAGQYSSVTQEPMGAGEGLSGANNGLALGDVDGDGRIDLVAEGLDNSGNPRLILFRNQGGTLAQDPTDIGPGLWQGAVALGDVNNDGALDLAVTGVDANGAHRFMIYLNDGQGHFTLSQEPWGAGTGFAQSDLVFCDVDSDGWLDLIVSGESTANGRGLNLFRNVGGTFTRQQEILPQGFGINQAHLALGDVDQDGAPDLVAAGRTWDGQNEHLLLLLFQNSGGTFGAGQTLYELPSASTGGNWAGVVLGDVDGNGFPDLMANGLDGSGTFDPQLYYFQNETGTLSLSELPPTSFIGPILFGEFANDGNLDLVTLPTRELYVNTLGPSDAPPAAPTGLRGTVDIVNGEIDLAWDAPADAESAAAALSYEVRVGTATAQYTIISGAYGPPLGSMPLTRLSPGQPGRRLRVDLSQTYFFQVRAIDTGLRAGPWSAEQAFVPGVFGSVVTSGDVTPSAYNGATLNSLSVGAHGAGSIDAAGGGALTVNGGPFEIAQLAGSTGIVTLTDAGTRFFANGGVVVGDGGATIGEAGAPADGILQVLSGAAVTTTSLALGVHWNDAGAGRASGTVIVDGAGSSLEVDGPTTAGMAGRAEIDVTGGGVLRCEGSLDAGQLAGSIATIAVDGAGSTLDLFGGPVIGDHGAGTLRMSGGATATLGGNSIFGGDFGGPASGVGTLEMDGAGTALTVGATDHGDQLYFGFSSGASGAGTLTNGATLTVLDQVSAASFYQSAHLGIGWNGAGTLDVLSGSRVLVHDRGIVPKVAQAFVGGSAPSGVTHGGGSLTVDGAGTTFEVSGTGANLIVGAGGPGTVVISNGASALVDGGHGSAFLSVGGGVSQVLTSTATLRLDGGSLTVQTSAAAGNNGFAGIGNDGGTGTVVIGAGGLLSTRFSSLGTMTFAGATTAGDGEIDVLPGGRLDLSGFYPPSNFSSGVRVGDTGTGRLVISSDGTTGGLFTQDGAGSTFPIIDVGNTVTGVGELDVIGPGATISCAGATGSNLLRVGVAGRGTARFLGGAHVGGLFSFQVGVTATAVGDVTIDGGGTQIVLTRVEHGATGVNAIEGQGPSFLVGRGGVGTLTLDDGAEILLHPDRPITSVTLSASFLVGGAKTLPNNGTGTATVRGGALVEIGGEMGAAIVGRDGTGTLTVEGGGAVRVLNPDGHGRGTIGQLPGASGALTVSGSASIFDGGSIVGIGVQVDGVSDGGAATVTLADGGTIAGATVRIGGPGALLGAGSIEGDVLIAGGMLAPSGTIDVSGTLTLVSGTARFEVDGMAPGAFDSIAAAGAVSLTAGAIEVHVGGGYAPADGDAVRILGGAGGSANASVSLSVTGLPSGITAALVPDSRGVSVAFTGPHAAAVPLRSSGSRGGCAMSAPGDAPLESLLPIVALIAMIVIGRRWTTRKNRSR